MSITSAQLKNAFKITDSYITLRYDRRTDSRSSVSQSFFVSSSATNFYIKATPVLRTADSTNIQFFLRKSTGDVQITPQSPLILSPRVSENSPTVPGEVVVKVLDADKLFSPFNVNSLNENIEISYPLVFTLVAGQEITPVFSGIPSISNFTFRVTEKTGGCAPLALNASWSIATTNVDVSQFKLRIKETGAEFACDSISDVVLNTAEQYGDVVSGEEELGNQSSIIATPTLTLEVIRISNLSVVATQLATSTNSITVGPLC